MTEVPPSTLRDPIASALNDWAARHPGWELGTPLVSRSGVTVRARRDARVVAIRLEPLRSGTPACARGERLQAVALEWEADPTLMDDLAATLVGLEGTSLAESVASGMATAGPDVDGSPERHRVELFIASGCNIACGFCCEAERIALRKYMPWDDVLDKIRQAAGRGVDILQFMGGEATLHPQFTEALRAARDLGMRTYVITNLLRWENRKFADEVAPLLDEIMISMHAAGADSGWKVTGVKDWWERFQRAIGNARETLRARVHCATVLSRFNQRDLASIADVLLPFRPVAWVMGNAVPVTGTRLDALETNLTLTEQRSMQPQFHALRQRCGATGCRLVFFCIPHCVLGPALWEDSHDSFLGDQDLSDTADKSVAAVNFWAEADYLEQPRPVVLGRTRPEACASCHRRASCGGYFTAYFERFGTSELVPHPT